MDSGRWFLVLPDSEQALAIARRVQPFACGSIAHASGRPWLMGCWAGDGIAVGSSDANRVAAIGTFSATEADLSRWAARGEEPELAGALHLIASLDGRVRVRGSMSGTHRVFHALMDGVTVAADRARTLAWLTGAPLDEGQLAMRMAYPQPPHPMEDTALWQGVEALAGGSVLTVDPTGAAHVRRWWQAPEPELPLEEGAHALRKALLEAVELRARGGGVLGMDLSGGLDSTSLCFLAARTGANLVMVTLRWAAAGNEDAVWADRAAAHLPGCERLVYGPDQLPAFFTGIGSLGDGRSEDEPTMSVREDAQQDAIDQELLARGVRLRLCGHGGDHVVQSPPSYVHDLLRRSPPEALRNAMGYRARHRWPAAATARMLLDRTPYRRWLAAASDSLTAPPTEWPEPWGTSPRLPPWASGDAAAAVAALLRRTEAEPLDPARGRHARIHQAQTVGRLGRQMTMRGLVTDSPFCDDRVIEACLAVRAEATASPWAYKPLLVRAMRGLVPDEVLTRTTKDHSGHEWFSGLKLQRPALAALAEDSLLVRYGLADADSLRRALLSPQLATVPAQPLEQTLGHEMWLRDLEAHPTPAYLRKEHHASAH
ncbi:lasso peptide isopeptide bond-forming cyclase [Pseudonocardia aurantiaca]|uniref:asparagine synthase (glutamine-hydrolyzing) n=1 Tax=Pseudonocardia aurantiaca TaxID=75290 RepID=A0ABW4FNA7_9PSEU